MPSPRHACATLFVVAVVLAACSGASAPAVETSGSLTIESHEDGETVSTASIQLRGTAPPNAEIVQDRSFARDARTSADDDGEWVLTVDLDEGSNDLTFRGDDESTSKTIRINYEPEIAGLTESPQPSGEATNSTPSPTPVPVPTPPPTQVAATFGGGDKIVGADVQPGTYRTRTSQAFCYWERLSGFGGTLDEIIANGTGGGYFTVAIAATDAGFNSNGCGTWSSDLSAVTDPAGPIADDGVYIVGLDVAAGTWQSSGGDGFGCYMARLSGFGGTLDEVIANDLSSEGGLVVTIAPTDVGFETSGCGTWIKVG